MVLGRISTDSYRQRRLLVMVPIDQSERLCDLIR